MQGFLRKCKGYEENSRVINKIQWLLRKFNGYENARVIKKMQGLLRKCQG